MDFNFVKYIIGWIAYLLSFLLLYRLKKHSIFITLLIAYLILITPTVSLFSLMNERYIYFANIIIPYIMLLIMISTKKIKIKFIKGGRIISVGISVVLTGIVFLHYLQIVGFNHINFNLNKVYILRRSMIGIKSTHGIFGYLNSWVTKVFNIILISYFLLKKRYFVALLFVAVQVLCFGFSGHKEVVFSLIILFGLYCSYKIFSDEKKIATIIIVGSTLINIFLLIYFYTSHYLLLPSILIRRVFFVPAYLNYVYMDFFSSNKFVNWSNGVLKFLYHYPYSVEPTHVIGAYLGHPDMNANTGLFGSGYMQFGFFGILIYVLFLAIYINFIQQFKNIPKWFINSVVLLPLLTMFISSDLLTSMLTHGGIVALLMLFMFNDKKVGEMYRDKKQ